MVCTCKEERGLYLLRLRTSGANVRFQCCDCRVSDGVCLVGWKLFAGNHRISPQRLKRLGWEAVETSRVPLMDSLPHDIEVIAHEQKAAS